MGNEALNAPPIGRRIAAGHRRKTVGRRRIAAAFRLLFLCHLYQHLRQWRKAGSSPTGADLLSKSQITHKKKIKSYRPTNTPQSVGWNTYGGGEFHFDCFHFRMFSLNLAAAEDDVRCPPYPTASFYTKVTRTAAINSAIYTRKRPLEWPPTGTFEKK